MTYKDQELTPFELRCIDEYLVDLNQVQAYLRAGGEAGSYDSARTVSSLLFAKQNVRAVLDSRMEEIHVSLHITAEQIARETARIAFFDPGKAFTESGELKDFSDMDEDTRACIESVTVEELFEGKPDNRQMTGYVKRVKFHSKNAALDKLMRYRAMYKDPGSSRDNPLFVKGISESIREVFSGSQEEPTSVSG